MSMFRLKMLVLASCCVALIGCGGSGEESVKPPETTPKERIISMLEGIAESGQGGSEVGAVMQELGQLEETDPALAKELETDARDLMSTQQSASQRKQKAEEMIKKLEGGSGG